MNENRQGAATWEVARAVAQAVKLIQVKLIEGASMRQRLPQQEQGQGDPKWKGQHHQHQTSLRV